MTNYERGEQSISQEPIERGGQGDVLKGNTRVPDGRTLEDRALVRAREFEELASEMAGKTSVKYIVELPITPPEDVPPLGPLATHGQEVEKVVLIDTTTSEVSEKAVKKEDEEPRGSAKGFGLPTIHTQGFSDGARAAGDTRGAEGTTETGQTIVYIPAPLPDISLITPESALDTAITLRDAAAKIHGPASKAMLKRAQALEDYALELEKRSNAA